MRCYKCGSFLTDGDTCPQCGENNRFLALVLYLLIIRLILRDSTAPVKSLTLALYSPAL